MRPQDDFVYFCFLDILGYRAHLKKDIETTSLNFKDKLEQASQIYSQINSANYAIKSISDSIFIHSSSVKISDFLKTVKKIYNHYLQTGLLIRGGISYSRHFETNIITYSLALTEAHHLESEKAVNPRVVISKTILDAVRNAELSNPQQQYFTELVSENLIMKEGDEYILHVIDDSNLKDFYRSARKIYQDNEADINTSANLRSKYRWLEDYIMISKPSDVRLDRFTSKMTLLT